MTEETLKCPQCGAEIKQNQKFCMNCGHKCDNQITVLNKIKSIFSDIWKLRKQANIKIVSAGALFVIALCAILVFNNISNQEFKDAGLGIVIGNDNGNVKILKIIDNMPAQKNDLNVGDIIYKVNGKKVSTVEEASYRMRGKEGTVARITIKRNDVKRNYRIKRAKL